MKKLYYYLLALFFNKLPKGFWEVVEKDFRKNNNSWLLCGGSALFASAWEKQGCNKQIKEAATSFFEENSYPHWRITNSILFCLSGLPEMYYETEQIALRAIRFEFLEYMKKK